MFYSKLFLPTLKETPSDAEVISHVLMLRAGLIRKVAAGIYSYLPLGLRVLRKVENIIREEMNRAGAQEVLLPGVQPAELWQESGRWEFYGPELLRLKDRHQREFCLGPTHEEVITDLVRREYKSYRQLPVNLYQIQTKFRDEIRPRFGIMRAREFSMKDAYSFDLDEAGCKKSYQDMYEAYTRIFSRCGLKFKAVEADTGSIGGSFSHEFMVLAETGEDAILCCPQCAYGANTERAELADLKGKAPEASAFKPLAKVATPDKKRVEEVCEFLKVTPQELVKTLILDTDKGFIAALIRGDHELNPLKIKNILGAEWCYLAQDRFVEEQTNAPVGFAGPVGLKIPVFADFAVQAMTNFVVGANEADAHFTNVNHTRDFKVEQFRDLRQAGVGDPCPRCGATLEVYRGIEVGHIFILGTKYSHKLKAVYLDEKGEEKEMIMGCYGIGVGRTAAAAVEQNHDADGIIFPLPLAPFQVIVTPVNFNDQTLKEAALKLHNELEREGMEVILDDRDERPGVKFKDADLLGIPIRLTVGSKGLKEGKIELKLRREKESRMVPQGEIIAKVKEIIAAG